MSEDDIRTAACRVDFQKRYEAGRITAGGGPSYEDLLGMTVGEVVHGLAHNGFRLVADKEYHLSRMGFISVTWCEEMQQELAKIKLEKSQ